MNGLISDKQPNSPSNLGSKRRQRTLLFATSSPMGGQRSSSSRRGSTARESAVIVEWEPISELQRRIDEGVFYEHIPELSRESKLDNEANEQDAERPMRAVFCGFRMTSEEKERLGSAHPCD